MRRSKWLVVLVAILLIGALPAAVDAARPDPPTITSVTITGDGGTWPVCYQTATVGYATGHRRAGIQVMPWTTFGPTDSFGTTVRGTGTVEIAVSNIYVSFDKNPMWSWRVDVFSRPGGGAWVETTQHSFADEVCPASGVLATWAP